MNRFLCVSGGFLLLSCSTGFAASVTATESPDGFLFLEGGENILFYQRTPKSFNGAYTRNNYVHPLWSLDGEVLTEDAPADHLHQRGLFWAWHQTRVGESRCGDAWSCQRFAWDVVTARTRPLPDGACRLDVTVLWKSPDCVDDRGQMQPIVQEKTAITIHPRRATYRLVDFEIRLSARQDQVTIGGSEDVKGYGGFSLRIKTPEDLVFYSGKGPVQPRNEAVTAGNWLDLNATFTPARGRSGITVMVHPDNPGITNQWILRQTRSMQNPVFPGREPVTVPRDRPLILKYRLVIHQGDWTQLAWDKMYRAYAEGRVDSGG